MRRSHCKICIMSTKTPSRKERGSGPVRRSLLWCKVMKAAGVILLVDFLRIIQHPPTVGNYLDSAHAGREANDLWALAPSCWFTRFLHGSSGCITSHICPEEFRLCHHRHGDRCWWQNIQGSSLKGRGNFLFLGFFSSLPVSDPLQMLVFKSASITYQLSSSSAGNCPSLLWLSFLKGSLIIFQWERPLSAAWISVVSFRISRSRREPKPDWLPFFLLLNYPIPFYFYFILLSCTNKEKKSCIPISSSQTSACL